ncbi:MAG: PAS domain S-box protein [Actinomycetota bacterium]
MDRTAIRAAFAFALVGAAWILLSDLFVETVVPPGIRHAAQSVKGIAFIAVAAAFVFVLVRRHGIQWQRADRSARESAEALRRSESRYRLLVERVPGVVWLNEVDRDDPDLTRCVYIAPQLKDLLGWTPEEWIADEDLWQRVIHPDDLAGVLEANDSAEQHGTLSMEYRAMHRDGSVVWIHDEAVRIPSEDDLPAYWQGVMVDITVQRVQDHAIHELSESLRRVFRASPLAISVLEPDGRVRHWNPAAERMFGWTERELVGKLISDVPEHEAREIEEVTRLTLAGQTITGMETVRSRKDGSLVDVSLSTAPFVGADGRVTGMLGIFDDITERKRVAVELARRQRQQEATAGLGLSALAAGALPALLDAASALVARTLGVSVAGVFELLPDERTLVLRSGVGWNPAVVGGSATVEERSLSAYALGIGEAVIVHDLASEARFPLSDLIVDHDVVSGVAAVVHGSDRPYGVLEVFSKTERAFDADDVRFLEAVATIVGLSIERQRAEAALRTAEEQHRSLVEGGPAIVYLHDASEAPSHVTYIGPQIVELLGYPHEAWTGDPLFWLNAVHPSDRQRVTRAASAAIERELALDIDYRMVAKDGAEVWVHDRAMVVRDQEGRALFRQGVLLDITDQRRAEDERRSALDRQLRLATRLELLHQIDRDVLAAASIHEMSERTLDHLRLLVPYERGTVAVIDRASGRFTNLAARAIPELTLEQGLDSYVPDDSTRDLLARDLRVDDLETVDPRTPFVRGALDLGIHSVLVIALDAEEGQTGTLILTSRAKNAFDEEAFDIAREVGSELAIAIEQTRLREALGERAEELGRLAEERRQMLHRIVRAQEEERERVALELHDGLGQLLTSISLFASDLENEVREEVRPRAVRVNELIRRAISDSRQLVWSLRPPELERLGLVPALRRMADETSVPELTVDLHEAIGDVRLAPETEAVVYRVVQEAVHNAQKHAHASAISILLQRNNGMLTSLVEDNGRGFDPVAVRPGRGLGLIGMRERAELVEGALVVESATDAGTRVRLSVPIASFDATEEAGE